MDDLHAGHRLWFFLLRAPARLHLHPVALLPRARSNPGRALRHAHRHVELRMHPVRAAHRLPPAAGGGRRGPAGLRHRVAGHAPSTPPRSIEAVEELHQLERLPPLLSSDHHVGRYDRPGPGKVQEGQTARPPRQPRMGHGTERLRRTAVYRLSKTLPGVGPGGPNDARAGPATLLAQASLAETPRRAGRKCDRRPEEPGLQPTELRQQDERCLSDGGHRRPHGAAQDRGIKNKFLLLLSFILFSPPSLSQVGKKTQDKLFTLRPFKSLLFFPAFVPFLSFFCTGQKYWSKVSIFCTGQKFRSCAFAQLWLCGSFYFS